METRSRSIVKALTWRASALVITTCVAWCVIGRADIAVSIGAADTLFKLTVYYLHERMWLRVKFGRLPPPDYEV